MHVMETANRFGAFALLAATLLALPATLLLSGCDTDTRIETVFVERPFFEEPPASAQGFLGYDEAAISLTVCGNCHVGQQAAWKQTGHANAWRSLQESSNPREFCENCHTVGPNGNAMTEGGWASSKDERYHDVQCESCHGPGQQHVENPDASQPMAAVGLGDLSDLTDLSRVTNCAQCHQGTHHPFVNEWAQSPHARVVGFAAARPDCAGCHRGQTAIQRFGDNSDYLEKNSTDHLPVTCVVCHDPHDATYEHQLRLPVNTTSIEEHLCAQCHNRRTAPDPNSSHGLEPHAPEADLLLGDAGWFPPGAQIDQGQIVASHGSASNARLCATCHVNGFEVTDPNTGDFVFNATGHLFTAIPCVDEQGIPKPGDCELTVAARSYRGCAAAQCHGSQAAAAEALTIATNRIQRRADQLLAALEMVDPNLGDAGGEIDPADPTFTVAEGAFFNYNLASFGGKVTGSSTHNPFLVEALLLASLQAVQDTYGVLPPSVSPSVNWHEALQEVLEQVPQNITPIRRASGTPRSSPSIDP